MLLLIDNYDSFVYNLGRYLTRLGAEVRIERNDAISVEQIRDMRPTALVLSPGPCTPDEAGICLEAVAAFRDELPMLGICLGHQVIGQAFGAKVVRAPRPVHGRRSMIRHDGRGLFAGLGERVEACRYHSLVLDESTLPAELVTCAWSDGDDCVMAVRHERLPLFGLQFHPESVLTAPGYHLLGNFLVAARVLGEDVARSIPDLYDERPAEPKLDEPQDPPPIYY